MYSGSASQSVIYDSSAGELVVNVPTSTAVEKASQFGAQSGGTRKDCRECNLATCGPKGNRSPSKMPTEGDTPPEAATMSGIASTTQEKISITIRTAGRKSRRCP
jgi:hypothetical protein